MSSNRRKVSVNTVTISLGCSCRRPRSLSNIFQYSKPKPKTPLTHHYYNSSSSTTPWNKLSSYESDTTTTTTTAATTTFFSPNTSSDAESEIKSLRAVQGFGRIGGESMAVEKDSDDPYLDFRRSMLQMIVEKEIYAKDDLKELLNCFLQLNSPYYHGTIIRVFTEIWNGVFSVRSASPKLMHKSRAF